MSNSADFDPAFAQLVLSLQAAAMQQMGKIMSPITGTVERDLLMAKHSIDLLEMLSNKTAGNLTPDEKRLLDHVLYELRMNYVDETAKGRETASPQGDKGTPGESGAS